MNATTRPIERRSREQMLAALAALDVDPQDASSVLIEVDAVTITRRIPILGGGDHV